jgi:sulfur carrier protein
MPGAVCIPTTSWLVTPPRSRYGREFVQVIVNDEPHALADGATVADLVETLGLGPRRIAVEVNRALVPRETYGDRRLADGDAVEIIHFVGGG